MNGDRQESVRRKQQVYREARAAKGETQMQIWVSESLRGQLDELVRSGKFKNRSELVSLAVNRFLEGQTS